MTRRRGFRGQLYGLAAVVGLGAGIGAIAFEYLSGWIGWLVLKSAVGYAPHGPHGELDLFPGPETATTAGIVVIGLVLAPALGGLLSSLLCGMAAREASGHGTDAVIDAYHNKNGDVRARVPIVKAVATALSLGTGGSGGREGPIAQIGAGIGAMLARVLDLRPRHRRILLAAGMGAGVGAIFKAPLAGALFAAEILYRDAELESEVVIPSFISSAVAYCVFCGWMGDFGRLFALRGAEYVFTDLGELLPYTVLAVALVPATLFYGWVFYGVGRVADRIPLPRPAVAALGGALTGLVGIALWQAAGDVRGLAVLSYGYGILQDALDGAVLGWGGAALLLWIALLKVVTTSFTISSGGSGGVFGPSMVIGGCLGGAVGIAFQQLGWVQNPGCFVVVGMTGFFAGAAKTPISTIIMVTEMTGSYELLVPAMWVCGITFVLSHRRTIYHSQVANRAHSAAHRGEYQVALLEKMKVADVFEFGEQPATVPTAMPLADVLRLIAHSKDDYFPVLDEHGRFVGIFSAHDVREFTFDESVHRIAIAADVMTSDPICLRLEDDLHTALEKFNLKKLDELPVVASEDAQHLLGVLRRRSIGRAYERSLKELRQLQREQA